LELDSKQILLTNGSVIKLETLINKTWMTKGKIPNKLKEIVELTKLEKRKE